MRPENFRRCSWAQNINAYYIYRAGHAVHMSMSMSDLTGNTSSISVLNYQSSQFDILGFAVVLSHGDSATQRMGTLQGYV